MKVYLVFGLEYDGLADSEFDYFYGVFETREDAEKIKNDLESVCEQNEWSSTYEDFVIREVILGEPTDLYRFMMEC